MSEHQITVGGDSITHNLELALVLARMFELTNGSARICQANGSVTLAVSCDPVELRQELEKASVE